MLHIALLIEALNTFNVEDQAIPACSAPRHAGSRSRVEPNGEHILCVLVDSSWRHVFNLELWYMVFRYANDDCWCINRGTTLLYFDVQHWCTSIVSNSRTRRGPHNNAIGYSQETKCETKVVNHWRKVASDWTEMTSVGRLHVQHAAWSQLFKASFYAADRLNTDIVFGTSDGEYFNLHTPPSNASLSMQVAHKVGFLRISLHRLNHSWSAR